MIGTQTHLFCMDFHRLNTHTKKDSYPLLQIQEALESMAGTVQFSTMDFKNRFWQVRMVPKSQQYTTFTVGNLEFYKFTHMPSGLCNAPTTFQCLMQNTLGNLNLTYCIIYLDDVMVFGCMEEEHLENLHVIFKQFHEFNLKLKPFECSFFQSEIIYLMHHVSHEGICPTKENMHAVEEFPMPETFTQVHTFCRLMGHYRHFIKGFAHIARPLYDVLGKEVKMGPVQLPSEVWEAVRILKDKIQSTPVLVYPDFDKPFLLETDAWVLSSHYVWESLPDAFGEKTITALSLSSLPSSGVSLNISRSTLLMRCSWYRLTTVH